MELTMSINTTIFQLLHLFLRLHLFVDRVVARSFLALFGLLRSLVDLFFGKSPALEHSSTIHAGQHWLVLLIVVHVVLVRVGNRNTISTSSLILVDLDRTHLLILPVEGNLWTVLDGRVVS
jgi:hypothetical protein